MIDKVTAYDLGKKVSAILSYADTVCRGNHLSPEEEEHLYRDVLNRVEARLRTPKLVPLRLRRSPSR